MCLAIPAKIVKIDGQKAIVEAENHTHIVDLSLIKDPKIGDYVLAHDELAINKVSPEEALKIIEMINVLPHNHGH